MFIPHGNYPEGHAFNSVTNNPRLFKEVDFGDFLTKLPSDRVSDFVQSDLFLGSSLYQDNLMTGLIMLLSAIERSVSAKHLPLDGLLRSNDFKNKITLASSGQEANEILQREVNGYISKYGSNKSVFSFYANNLTNEQKLILINGILFANKYKKSVPPKGSDFVALYTPVYESGPSIDVTDTAALNDALKKRIKAVIYDIRNGFVHRSRWIPFGNEEYIKQQGVYTHERYENGEPKDTWHITMTFKQLHEISVEAFQTFWLGEYKNIQGLVVTDDLQITNPNIRS